MADSSDKSGELILTLQNRINDLEAKLSGLETERKSKTWVESSALDSKIAEVKAIIGALEQKHEALIKGKGNDNGDSSRNTENWLEGIIKNLGF